jgi:hypothetical protein
MHLDARLADGSTLSFATAEKQSYAASFVSEMAARYQIKRDDRGYSQYELKPVLFL